jgi:hypothetical protein
MLFIPVVAGTVRVTGVAWVALRQPPAILVYCTGQFLRTASIRMDTFTTFFWLFTVLFVGMSGYLLCCKKRSNAFYLQIGSGLGIFATSKIGRKFLGLE